MCSITGSAGICIEVSFDQTANQTCNFNQVGSLTSPHANLAIALQVILSRNGGPSGLQGGTQLVNTTQQNNTKPNLSFASQIIKQSLGLGSDNTDAEVGSQAVIEQNAQLQGVLPNFGSLIGTLQSTEPSQEGDEPTATPTFTGDVQQTQQSQQNVNVCQGDLGSCNSGTGMTAANLSAVYQSLRQRERSAMTNDIKQFQNPVAALTCPGSLLPFNANMCARVDQKSTGGQNASGLVELYRQFQSARYSNTATQKQDAGTGQGGMDHNVHQTSLSGTPGVERIFTDQRGRQVQRAANIVGALLQTQDPRTGKGAGSFQSGSANDTWMGNAIATQIQTVDGSFSAPTVGAQDQRLTYDADSSGKINAFIQGTENGHTNSNTCTNATACHVQVLCTSATFSEVLVPGDCVPGPSPPPPSLIGRFRR